MENLLKYCDIIRESTSCGVTSDEEDDELIRIELETILGKDNHISKGFVIFI